MKILFSILFVFSLVSAANYPFPQNKVAFGIKVTTDGSADVQSVYQSWLSGYYEEQGDLARIDWDTKSQTVSEGIGYGLLIMVCMDNAQNNTRPKFDKLWRYYKKFRNNNGVMNWKIDGFNAVTGDGKNGATDAELDAATALVLAYRQWGDESYKSDAVALISAIWNTEVNANRYLKPGDAWDTKKNLSYFSTGALELFKSVDSHDWSTVITKSFTLLKKVCNSTTGLPPDWCSEDGNTLMGQFGYEAVRVPWRMAWAYSWFGQKDAGDIDAKIATWIRGATGNSPSAIKANYSLTGSAQENSNAAFTGALSCAGMTSADNQDWVNLGLAATKSAVTNSYYNKTLQVLYMLLLSGNFSLMTGSPTAAHQVYPAIAPRPGRYYHVITTGANGRYFSLTGKKIAGSACFTLQPLIRMR
jgi:endoglucanase